MSKRKNYAPAFKARVALAVLSGEKTVAERSAEFGVRHSAELPGRLIEQI